MLALAATTPPALRSAVTTTEATPAATPAATLAPAVAPQLVWMSQSDWQKVVTRRELKADEKAERPRLTVASQFNQKHRPAAEWTSSNCYGACVKRFHSDERAAAVGFTDEWSTKAVRRAERSREDPERAAIERALDARRKRVRRIEEGKEDRDALRELASSRDFDVALPLEATPVGLRETAVDSTPRSAKAAGAKLRRLTQSFYERLLDPRFYNFDHEDLQRVQVTTEFWQPAHSVEVSRDPKCVVFTRKGPQWETGVRPLQRYANWYAE